MIRRIGGLEMDGDTYPIEQKVIRRKGGLESQTDMMCLPDCVICRIGSACPAPCGRVD